MPTTDPRRLAAQTPPAIEDTANQAVDLTSALIRIDAASLMIKRVQASGEALVERVACGVCTGSRTLGDAAA